MTIDVYGYVPAWGLPDISPYVTKLIFWLKVNKIPFEHKPQNLGTLDADAPYGKLPYIINTDDGTKVADSNTIIDYLIKKFDVKLDNSLSKEEHAVSLAFERLINEHLYFSGILEPRWRMDEGWEVYIPYIVQGAEVGPDLRAVLDGFRVRILDGYKGQGMGRRDSPTVLEFYKRDVDALSDFLGSKPYMLGDKIHTVDVALYAMLRHLVDQPQKWPGTGYVETKKNLTDFMEKMRKDYDM